MDDNFKATRMHDSELLGGVRKGRQIVLERWYRRGTGKEEPRYLGRQKSVFNIRVKNLWMGFMFRFITYLMLLKFFQHKNHPHFNRVNEI